MKLSKTSFINHRRTAYRTLNHIVAQFGYINDEIDEDLRGYYYSALDRYPFEFYMVLGHYLTPNRISRGTILL